MIKDELLRLECPGCHAMPFGKHAPDCPERKRLMAQNEHDRLVEKINEMDQKLSDTAEALRWNTGPVNDTMKLVVPMMKDQLALMKEIVDYAGRATF